MKTLTLSLAIVITLCIASTAQAQPLSMLIAEHAQPPAALRLKFAPDAVESTIFAWPIVDFSFREAAERIPVVLAPGAPSWRTRADVFLGSFSLSAASVALGVTMACTSDKTCTEVNGVMRKVIGDSRSNAIMFKSALGLGLHYGGWRLIKPGKKRTAYFAGLAIINGLDAFHDIRTLRKIDRARTR